jgi:hypothetical protein
MSGFCAIAETSGSFLIECKRHRFSTRNVPVLMPLWCLFLLMCVLHKICSLLVMLMQEGVLRTSKQAPLSHASSHLFQFSVLLSVPPSVVYLPRLARGHSLFAVQYSEFKCIFSGFRFCTEILSLAYLTTASQLRKLCSVQWDYERRVGATVEGKLHVLRNALVFYEVSSKVWSVLVRIRFCNFR